MTALGAPVRSGTDAAASIGIHGAAIPAPPPRVDGAACSTVSGTEVVLQVRVAGPSPQVLRDRTTSQPGVGARTAGPNIRARAHTGARDTSHARAREGSVREAT